MSTDEPRKIVGFPQPEITPEERARRLTVEVARLSRLAPGEWRLWADETCEKHKVSHDVLKAMVEETIRANEKAARDAKVEGRYQKRDAERRADKAADKAEAQARREEERARKAQEKADKEAVRIDREQELRRKKHETVFAEIAKLPQLTHATRIKEAAARLGEDFDELYEEFKVHLAARSIPEELEPWSEPVDTAELLVEIETKFRRYVVVSDAIAAATALWVAFTYIVEIAVHAPKLLFHFPRKDAGKSTALGVLHWVVQRPYAAVEATGAAVYRIIDRLKPTLLLDEADTLFRRNTLLAHVINASWTNSGQKIPRVGPGGAVVEYDPYSAQAISMKGLHMPDTTLSRCIVCMIWPKLPSEVVEDFCYVDDEEFKTIRRKLTRWAVDNAAAIRDANPESAPGFNNRVKMNWKILLAIADLAGGDWPARARAAALELYNNEADSEADDDIRAFAMMEQLFHAREEVTSAEACAALTADPTSEWCNFRGKGPISQAQLAALFRPYGIYTVKLSGGRGYRRAQFKQPFARLLRKTTKEPENRKQTKDKRLKLLKK